MVTNKKVKWGVLSTASIGVRKVLPGMQLGEWSEIVAIASRDGKKAEEHRTQAAHSQSLLVVRRTACRPGDRGYL